MSLTLQSAVKEMNACSSNRFQEICDAVSKGALRGARGNSGVISSQIFRGICSVLKDTKDAFDTKTFAKAMEAGTKVAYSAVSIPKEGTILTVVRLMSEAAPQACKQEQKISLNFSKRTTNILTGGIKMVIMAASTLPFLMNCQMAQKDYSILISLYN